MADQKITELTTTTPVDTDEGVLQRGSANFKFLFSALRTYLSATFLSDAPSDGSTYGRKDGAWAAVSTGGSAHVIKDETVSLTARANLNFAGAGVTVTDNAGTDSSDVTIPGVSTHESTYNHANYDTHLAASAPHTGHLDTADLGVSVQAFDADTVKSDVTRAFTKLQFFTPLTGSTGGAATLDFEDGNVVHSTLTSNVTSVAAPTNMSDGAQCVWRVQQDGTGGRTIGGWNASYKFRGGGTVPTAATAANAGDSFVIERVGSNYWVTHAGNFQ